MQQARQISSKARVVNPVQPSRTPVIRPEPGRKSKKVKLVIVFSLCFLLSLAVIAQYSSLVILNYRLSAARAELASIQEASRILELEVASLSSVGRIEQIARDELGMIDPELAQMRVLTAGLSGGSRLGE